MMDRSRYDTLQGSSVAEGYTDYKISLDGLQLTIADNGRTIANQGATGAVTVMLPSNPSVGTYFNFVVYVNQELRIDPGTAKISFSSLAVSDKYWTANARGESAQLVALSSSEWGVVSSIGTWTQEA